MAGVERDKMMYVAFGRRFNGSAITALREAIGLSKNEFARQVFGISDPRGSYHGLIRDYENGLTKPRLDTLRAMCDVLGCTLNDLAPKVDQAKEPQHTDKRIKIPAVKYHPSWHWG